MAADDGLNPNNEKMICPICGAEKSPQARKCRERKAHNGQGLVDLVPQSQYQPAATEPKTEQTKKKSSQERKRAAKIANAKDKYREENPPNYLELAADIQNLRNKHRGIPAAEVEKWIKTLWK